MIEVLWDNPQKNIILLNYFNPVSCWGEYREAIKQAHKMARSVNYQVHIIHNGQGVKMPLNSKNSALEEVGITLRDVPDNVGLLMSTTTTAVEHRIIRVATQISLKPDSLKFVVVDSIDKAYELIEAFESGKDFHVFTKNM